MATRRLQHLTACLAAPTTPRRPPTAREAAAAGPPPLLQGAADAIRRGAHADADGSGVHSMLVWQGGSSVEGGLVLEEYFEGGLYDCGYARIGGRMWRQEGAAGEWAALLESPGSSVWDGARTTYNADSLHYVASVNKSVTSLLVGAAVAAGHLSLDAPLASFFPEHAELLAGGKERIQLSHLLSMSAGLVFDEMGRKPWDGEPSVGDSHGEMDNHPAGPVRWTLEQPLEAEPGAKFCYNSGERLS